MFHNLFCRSRSHFTKNLEIFEGRKEASAYLSPSQQLIYYILQKDYSHSVLGGVFIAYQMTVTLSVQEYQKLVTEWS